MATGEDLRTVKSAIKDFKKANMQSQTELIAENVYVMD